MVVKSLPSSGTVVPYIGTWIETISEGVIDKPETVVPYIGTWIETSQKTEIEPSLLRRTLYRYVD